MTYDYDFFLEIFVQIAYDFISLEALWNNLPDYCTCTIICRLSIFELFFFCD